MRASMVIAGAGCGTGGKFRPGNPAGRADGLPEFALGFFDDSSGNGRGERKESMRRSAAAGMHAVYPGRA